MRVAAMRYTVRYTFFFLFLFTASVCSANDTWFVDGRKADLSSVARLDEEGRWQDSVLDELLRTHQPDKPLLILVHGNDMSYGESKYYGKLAAGMLKNSGAHRLVIWSWAAERVLCRIRKDALMKVQRADAQGAVLASFLKKLPEGSKTSLGGFSLGASVVCGALQVLPESSEPSLQIRTVLLAAAIDRNSLSAAGKYRDAVSKTERFLIYTNPDDWVLRFYPLLNGNDRQEAVGRFGASLSGQSKTVRRKVESVNVQKRLGSEHAFIQSLRAFSSDKTRFKCYAIFE